MTAEELFAELFFGDISGFLGLLILVIIVVYGASKNKWVDLLGFVMFIVLGLEYFSNADQTKPIFWAFPLCWFIAIGLIFDLLRRRH